MVEVTVYLAEHGTGTSSVKKLAFGEVTYAEILKHVENAHGRDGWIIHDSGDDSGQAKGSHVEVIPAKISNKPEEIHVIPNPNSAEQDVKPMFTAVGVKGGLEDLIDNAINALLGSGMRNRMPRGWKPHLWVDFIDDSDDAEARLVVQDNGVGMPHDVLKNYLVEGSTYSRIPEIPRKADPMCIDLYINPALNRYGRGCNVLMGFGCSYIITTREVGRIVSHCLTADSDEWKADRVRGGTGWKAKVTRMVHDDDVVAAGPSAGGLDPSASFSLQSGTQIIIKRLKPHVLAELRNGAALKRLTAEIAQDYFLFISGIPDFIRDKVPEKLQYDPVDSGLTMEIFKTVLHKDKLGSLPEDETPVLFRTMSAYQKVAAKKADNMPFFLFLRYVPPALKDEKLDNDVHIVCLEDSGLAALNKVSAAAKELLDTGLCPTAAKKAAEGTPIGRGRKSGAAAGATSTGARGSGARTPATGGPSGSARKTPASTAPGTQRRTLPEEPAPVGPLQERDPVEDGVPRYVDMMLVLLYFPVEGGHTSKPNAGKGVPVSSDDDWTKREPFVFPFWSGRLLPQCDFMSGLPRMVEKAVELGNRVQESCSFKLNDRHLCGMLLVSPESDTTKHKTDLEGKSYDAFKHFGPSADEALHKGPVPAGPGMHTYNFAKESFEADPAGALATRLLVSHFTEFWRPLDEEGRIEGLEISECPFSDDLVGQGSKYNLGGNPIFKDAICEGELVRLVDPKQGIAAPVPGEAGNREKLAKYFYEVVRFYQFGKDSLLEHKVALRKWMPSFSQHKEEPELHPVVHMAPLEFATHVQRMARSRELVEIWEADKAPHHLAFLKATKDKGRHQDKGKAADKGKQQERANRETTETAAEVRGLAAEFYVNNVVDQVHVVLASQSGKPLSINTLATNFDVPHLGRTLCVSLQRKDDKKDDNRRGSQGWTQKWRHEFPNVDSWAEFHVTGLKEHVCSEGSYLLHMRLKTGTEIMGPHDELEYCFTVKASPAAEVAAKFVDSSNRDVLQERLRLGKPANKLVVNLLDANGNQVAFPSTSALSQSIKLDVLMQGNGSDWVPLPVPAQPHGNRKDTLSDDKQTLTIENFEVPGFKLGGGSLDVQLVVGLALPGAPAPKACKLTLTLFAGTPVKLGFVQGDAHAKRPIAKGCPLSKDGSQPGFNLEDTWGNMYIHQQAETQGQQSQGAATAGALLSAELSMSNVSDQGGFVITRRVVKFDRGGVLALPENLCAMGPVGSLATVSVHVSVLEVSATDIISRQIFPVHLGFEHPLLAEEEPAETSRSSSRRTAVSGQGQAGRSSSRYQGISKIYRLDLLDRMTRYNSALLLPKLINTELMSSNTDLISGLEVRVRELGQGCDILVCADQSWISPDGTRYPVHKQKHLIDKLNDAIKENRVVHEVACVVKPGALKLCGMSVLVCNAADDAVDPDWSANIKMHLENGARRWDLQDLRYNPQRRQGPGDQQQQEPQQIPDIELPPDLFEAGPTAKLVFADCHAPGITYGWFYIRQEARPCKVALLPVGQTFLNASLKHGTATGILKNQSAEKEASRLTGLAGAPSAAQQQGADEAAGRTPDADPFATLQGWKLQQSNNQHSTLSMDNPADLAVVVPGPAVQRNQPFRLYCVACDVLGAPIEIPVPLRPLMEQHAELTAASGPAADAARGPAADGSAAQQQAVLEGQQLPASIVPGSWRWHSMPTGARKSNLGTWQMPVFSMEVIIGAGSGSAVLQLQLSVPASSGHAAPSSSRQQQQQQQAHQGLDLGVVELPVTFAVLPMKRDGYLVRSAGNVRVAVAARQQAGGRVASLGRGKRPRWRRDDGEDAEDMEEEGEEDDAGDAQAGAAAAVAGSGAAAASGTSAAGAAAGQGMAAPDHVKVEVACPEDEELSLEVVLLDVDGQPLSHDAKGEFTARCSTLGQAWANGKKLQVEAGVIKIRCHVPRANLPTTGASPEERRQPLPAVVARHTLEVRPLSPSLTHALPLWLQLAVGPGRYPHRLKVVPTREWGISPGQRALNLGQLEPELPLPQLCVLAADGTVWIPPVQPAERRHAGPSISLRWGRLDASGHSISDGPQVPPVVPSTVAEATESTGSAGDSTTAGQVPWPKQPGTWFLSATMAEVHDEKLVLLEVEVSPGPPHGLVLDTASVQAWASGGWKPLPEKTVMQRQQIRDVRLPVTQGCLVDCFGNPVVPATWHKVALVMRPSEQQAGPDLGQPANGNAVVVSSCELHESSRFELVAERSLLQAAQQLDACQQQQGFAGVLPSYDLVLLCQEHKAGQHGEWQQLQQCLPELPVATLMLASETTVNLAQRISKNTHQREMIKREQRTAAKTLADAEAAASKKSQQLKQLTQEVGNLGGDLERAITDLDLKINNLSADLEDGPMVPLDPRFPWLLSPWFKRQPLQGMRRLNPNQQAILDLAVEMCSLPLAQGAGEVLGPVICLAAVERREVALALATLAGMDGLFMIVVRGSGAAAEVKNLLRQRNVQDWAVMDLEDANVQRQFSREGVAADSPQQLLIMQQQRQLLPVLNPPPVNGQQQQQQPIRFVGFAANLVHLPPGINGQAWRYQGLTLRQSVFSYFFGDAMVFEREQDIDLFKQRCRALNIPIRNRLIALDGGAYNLRPGIDSRRQPLSLSFGWSQVPAQRQLAAPLDAWVGSTHNKIQRLQQERQHTSNLGLRQADLQREVTQATADVKSARQRQQALDKTAREQLPKLQELIDKDTEELRCLETAQPAQGAAPAHRGGQAAQAGQQQGAAAQRRGQRAFGSGGSGPSAKRGTQEGGASHMEGGDATDPGQPGSGSGKRRRK